MMEYLEGLTDPRQPKKVLHSFTETIMLVICAVTAGCDVWEDIADYCRVKEDWFREKLGLQLTNGIPSHDTMERIFGMLNPDEFRKAFIEWVQQSCGKQAQEIISIDGKTMRGSKGKEQQPIHMVSAWANQAKVVFGQLAVNEKSNEITAADYVIGLKDNQPTLRKEAEEYFVSALETPQFYPHVSRTVTHNQGHGRIETREYYLSTDPDLLNLYTEWRDLNSIGMMKSRIIQNETTTEEIHYYISSLTDVNDFSKAARSHWGVENSLHWCLDVTFREDHSRMRKDHSAENFAVVRHMVLNVLKNMPDKMSVARRRRHCSYDDDYLASVLLSFHA